MNKKILCLNGWGQKPKTLENAFKEVFKDADISTIDYLIPNPLKNKILTEHDIVIGWSFGSQMAVRYIEAGFLKTKLLILIAPIFQFVENETNKVGMPKEMFDGFFKGFKEYPDAIMQQLIQMSATGDENSNLVFDKMKTQDCSKHYLNVFSNIALEQQLLELKKFSCFDVNFKNFPKTICFSGVNDTVVASSQTKLFAERIEDFELHIIENCGHAPHFSHMEEIKKILI
jgi:pimeloyl-ACP methyl ester carboxylesterase